ncbi:hypothetical protein ETD86_05210 [Nonomuraea turkmeniaca]|uniref:Uncharacterized protein n=1 Tax=Nonomuraea turkmeniaca TaxID=103838 RepID=A0A5S4FVB9_9ACTN|nr:hypothetical protein [Nonomuraea turkmeniaca]TMR24304.1 hypothetical protein ETD86_05210 [Nonomuraea turkmeniaca]
MSLAVALISLTASIAEMLVDLYVVFATDDLAQLLVSKASWETWLAADRADAGSTPAPRPARASAAA